MWVEAKLEYMKAKKFAKEAVAMQLQGRKHLIN